MYLLILELVAKNSRLNFSQTKRGANGGFLPKPLLLRLRHPNSKTNQSKFWQILSLKNCFAKTSSALFRHLPEYLEGRTPKEISPPPNQKCKECFFFRGCRGFARQWRNDSFIIRVLLKIHSNFVQNIPQSLRKAKTLRRRAMRLRALRG